EQKQYEELRAKQQALIEKDKGNEYFKTGDYDAANDCYTRGMEADPHNALLPANRAMAFLKLKKYELAESDCNLAIQLDPSYPKAFARRGAARLALNKLKEAREDFEAVLTFDPVNKQAIAELKKIKEIYIQTKHCHLIVEHINTEPSNVVQPFTRQPHLRSKKPLRRMTIEEVGSDMQPKMVADGEEAEATGGAVVGDEGDTRRHGNRRVTGSEQPGVIFQSITCSCLQSKSLASSSTCLNVEKDGIQNYFKKHPKMTWHPNASQTVSVPPPPSNSFQLESDLRQLKGRPNLLYQYIKQIAPIAFPQIMQQPLEPDVLYKLLNVLKESYIPHEDKALIFAVLHNLSLVRRFDMAVMFMSTTEKAVARALFDHIASAEDISGASVTALKTKYSL
uniref:RNA polymerase II-associated protein 3 n=1 Tax=Petromyzon marinus TaxID=7757 RepID=S4RKL4_PETMA